MSEPSPATPPARSTPWWRYLLYAPVLLVPFVLLQIPIVQTALFALLAEMRSGSARGVVLYFVGCAFRAFTGFLFVASIVMLLVSLGVFVNPNAAPMPWWFFLSSAFGMFVFAVGYNLFLDWFAPPGAEDPFDRYRPKANGRA